MLYGTVLMCIILAIFVYTYYSIIMHKRTNIELDLELINKALKITNLSTIKDVVHYALQETIKMNQRKNLLKLKGNVNWEGNLEDVRAI